MSAPRSLDNSEAASLLQEQALEDRLNPKPGAKLYLHLADLRQALSSVATGEKLEVLDFGCGGSPYRSLFTHANYYRADLAGMKDLDFVIQPGQPLETGGKTFDRVLSTQVLEHVEDVAGYLAECRRLLKPGGRLILSTHGTFPDHGAPWDFQRWTPHGLARDIERAGFSVNNQVRLTSGPRAVLQLWELCMERFPNRGLPGLAFRILRGLTRRYRAGMHRWADAHLASHCVANSADAPLHRLYLGLLVEAIAI